MSHFTIAQSKVSCYLCVLSNTGLLLYFKLRS